MGNWQTVINENLLPSFKNKSSDFVKSAYRELKIMVENGPSRMQFSNKGSKHLNKLKTEILKESAENGIKEFINDSDTSSQILKEFMLNYIREHLEINLTKLDRQLFVLDTNISKDGNVKTYEFTNRISPDIQGNITASVMNSGAILKKYNELINNDKKSNSKLHPESYYEHDLTKLMEGYKYYGKDIDVNEWYKDCETSFNFSEGEAPKTKGKSKSTLT